MRATIDATRLRAFGASCRRVAAAALTGAILLGGAAAAQAQEAAPDPTRIVQVRARDGVELAAAVYLPPGKGPFPTLLAVSSYRFDNDKVPALRAFVWKETGPIAYYLQHGYAYVHLDLRGSGRSGGRYRYFDLKDGDDSADVIGWIARQPWSNGKVGGVGHSIYAIEQWYMAASGPEHLSCIAPFDGGTDIYQMAHPGGVSEGFEANIYNNQFRVLNLYPLEGPPRVLEVDYPLLTLEHTALDSYWKAKVVQPELGRVTIPVFSIGVWQNVNNHLQGNIDGYQAVLGPKKLLVFGTNAQARFETRPFQDRYILPFYDWCLKGERTAYLDRPPVSFFMPGAGGFYQAKSWPPEGTHDRTLYLSARPSGSVTSLNDGTLALDAPPATGGQTAYAYPNPHWTSGVVGEGPDGKPDPVRYILTYTSAPLTQDLAVTGSPRLVLYLDSTRPDTWVFVRLSDQAPESEADRAKGLQASARMVTRGALAVTHRDSDTAPTPIVPGKVYRLVVPLKPTANLFRKGNRIRVEIANGDSALTDGPFAAIARPNQVGEDTVHHSAAYPSALILPVAPASLQPAPAQAVAGP